MSHPNPFPGMDPYLYRLWEDVHSKLGVYAAEAIQLQLGDALVARSGKRVFVEVPDDEGDSPTARSGRDFVPDAHVTEGLGSPHTLKGSLQSGGVATAGASATLVPIDVEPTIQRHVQIIDTSDGGRVVTVIEFVSPSNKRHGPGRKSYLKKQRACRRRRVNLVEVDLVRAGKRVILADGSPLARPRRTPYAASVWRAVDPGQCALYAVGVRDPLPTIDVPLRPGDADVRLDLRAVLARAYEAGRYDKSINYSKPLVPPLDDADAAWAAGLVAARTT